MRGLPGHGLDGVDVAEAGTRTEKVEGFILLERGGAPPVLDARA